MEPNQRLRTERERRGWSQARVAEQLDTDPINVSRWERGFSTPSPHYRERLCTLYEMPADELGLVRRAAAPPESSVALVATGPARASRAVASLSYLFWWLTALVVLVLARRDRFALFHAAQGALFFGAVTVIDGVLLGVLDTVTSEAVLTPLTFLLIAVNVVAFAWWLGGAWLAWRGVRYPLPLLGRASEWIVRALAFDSTPPTRP